jgi:Fic family protein
MLLDATRNHTKPLTAERLKGWQAALFPGGYSGIRKVVTGAWRGGAEPMRVVSGPHGKEKVHFTAPPAADVEHMMVEFLEWFRSPPEELDGLVRAAVAHLWFVTVHPFDDGNGRVARALTDMAFAQDDDSELPLHRMSAQIVAERSEYYMVLERTQKGDGDVTEWILWFLGCLERAMRRSEEEVRKATLKAKMWRDFGPLGLNERQRKVVDRLFEAGPAGFEGGLTNRKYVGMTGTSRETAKRDMNDLVVKGMLARNPGGGRSASYSLVWPD